MACLQAAETAAAQSNEQTPSTITSSYLVQWRWQHILAGQPGEYVSGAEQSSGTTFGPITSSAQQTGGTWCPNWHRVERGLLEYAAGIAESFLGEGYCEPGGRFNLANCEATEYVVQQAYKAGWQDLVAGFLGYRDEPINGIPGP